MLMSPACKPQTCYEAFTNVKTDGKALPFSNTCYFYSLWTQISNYIQLQSRKVITMQGDRYAKGQNNLARLLGPDSHDS